MPFLMQLAYLPDRKRDYLFDDDVGSLDSELSAGAQCDSISLEELRKDYKKGKRRGMLGWFKLRVTCNLKLIQTYKPFISFNFHC